MKEQSYYIPDKEIHAHTHTNAHTYTVLHANA